MTAHLSRRSLLRAAPALVMPVTLTAPLPALAGAVATPDPLPGYVRDFKAALEQWLAASDEPGGGNFDTLACLHWNAEMNHLRELIQDTVATSPEGLAAQIEFIKADYDAGPPCAYDYPTVDDVPVPFLDLILEGLRGIAQ
ncbi:hypothetical protein Rumeso_04579 [Rubellimicrobium mesophilum DSM 19309]|uniref:Twin-arginine translocation pathway signal n=1 Tax=Rubellimicrobium mesophilum DSM 19309 TaxID=442562 RepID=A0A017HJ77_9RHOB|nr:hypothetical protein [Rubellimicrobium mesophilum]EYD73844.1 hypothetical protein Rumeso_04579 [Rubellimicrobium mesophilum DSM 19309]